MKNATLLRLSVTLNLLLFFFLIAAFKPNPPQSNQIDLTTAKEYLQNNSETTKAILLDKETIADLNTILVQNNGANGVRVYFGKDANGGINNVLVPVKENFSDDTRYLLKSTNTVSICPHICDAESELTK